MHPLLSWKNLAIGGLGAAVIGLGSVVVMDHAAASTAKPQPASLSAASTSATTNFRTGDFAAGQLKNEASQVFGFFTTDTKLTWQQIAADVLKGETLDQIAGANAAKVESDALAEVKAGLEIGVTKGAISSAEEARLVNDARDAISVLMAAKLSALLPSGH
jgi:transcription elongation factor